MVVWRDCPFYDFGGSRLYLAVVVQRYFNDYGPFYASPSIKGLKVDLSQGGSMTEKLG